MLWFFLSLHDTTVREMDGFIFVQNKSTDGDPRPKKKKKAEAGRRVREVYLRLSFFCLQSPNSRLLSLL